MSVTIQLPASWILKHIYMFAIMMYLQKTTTTSQQDIQTLLDIRYHIRYIYRILDELLFDINFY